LAKAPANENEGILLEQLSWDEAERVLTPEQVVVIPLGAESKEHGRHLPLNNDWVMAEYFKRRVLASARVVVAPTINYSFYPAFLEYPGSTSLGLDTARGMVVDIVHSLAHYGPRRFYIINTGISTLRSLAQAADELGKEGILLRYLDFTKEDPVEKKVRQSGGTHADEIETSVMLYIAPEIVRMEKASRDLNQDRPGATDARSERAGAVFANGCVGRSNAGDAGKRTRGGRVECGDDFERHRGFAASRSPEVDGYFAQRKPTKGCAPSGGWLSRYSTHRFTGNASKLPPRITRRVFTCRKSLP
jgi:creatinine amidohydrolase